MPHPLIATIRNYTSFPDDEAYFFLSLFSEKAYKKGAVLLEEGRVANEVFFIMKGVVRQYFLNEEGQERTCNLSMEHEFITDLESFSRKSRSASSIAALEPTTCMVITCADLVKALTASPATAEFFRIVMENVAAENIRRTKALLSLSPEKQFSDLVRDKPELLQRVPQRYIAQYLGIAPESLSRIRKRMMVPQKS
ncbi:Crp/Fnr family transcriptional regulator [Niabella beijingensis]|uniref:Crp/Fnr family transcriptional regulator n=1 Tax=Niabella beijingensis TaxID=2872700 RepID=UPI001CBE3725|nr:Crp/Fnr family transcriptional regulator [Niabella beijingensis]MBZ4191759.1 Crp/Fnr family transcriptional regulator [Niabella beijingensis]